MAWPILAAMAGGALLGAAKSKAQREADANAMELNAEQMKYSPWTGMKTDMRSAGPNSMIASVGEGALSGAMFGSQFGGGGMGGMMGGGDAMGAAGAGMAKQNMYKPNNYALNMSRGFGTGNVG